MSTQTHHGFEVSGKSPNKPWRFTADTFTLLGAALECARMLNSADWTHITVSEVLIDQAGQTELASIEWRAGVTA